MVPQGISHEQVRDVQRMATLIPVTTVEQHLRPCRVRLVQALALIEAERVTGETTRLHTLLEAMLADIDVSLRACGQWRSQVPLLLDEGLAVTVILAEDSRRKVEAQEVVA